MMNKNLEKGCHWTFMKWDGVTLYGPNDAITQSFNKDFYDSLVRESIQNSMDAKEDKSEPVKVTFTFDKISNVDYPELFNLRTHIEGCLESNKGSQRAIDLYEPMLTLLPQNPNTEIDIITVSDNGDGMQYDPNNPLNTFSAFTRSVGLSLKKSKGSGGSFGFGKAAYFQMSPFRAILVSSMTRNSRETYFEGVARLCTHLIGDVRYSNVGYYNTDGKPSSGDAIPEKFCRTEPGTSITLIGKYANADNNAAMADKLIKAVLKHFWLAIYTKKLEVTVEKTTIKSGDIERLLKIYFEPSEKDSPINLFEAYTHSEDDDHKHIYGTTETLGEVQLHIKVSSSIKRDRVTYMREPMMLVEAKSTQTYMGIIGLFLCLDKEGNAILSNIEDASHSSWSTSGKKGKAEDTAAKALKEIADFVDKSIKDIFGSTGETEIIDLPLEFSPKETDSFIKEKSERTNPFGTGQIGNQIEEGGSLNTRAKDEIKADNNMNTGNIGKGSQGNPDGNGKGQDTGHGHTQRKSKKKGGKSTAGTIKRKSTPEIEDGGRKFSLYTPTTYRTPAYVKDGEWFHDIILHIDEDLDHAFIEIKVCTEDGADSIGIAFTDRGEKGQGKGIIEFDHLNKGKQKITIQFTDKQRHTIKLR